MSGIEFVNKVAKLAEVHQHHPNIEIGYKEVKISLTTHDEGDKVTEKDNKLAKEIDTIV